MDAIDPFARRPLNQSAPLIGHNTVTGDPGMVDAIRSQTGDLAGAVLASLDEVGQRAGSAEVREAGRLANAHPPVLRTADAVGERIDEVEFHPSWHRLLGEGVRHGLAGSAWCSGGPLPHVRRAAAFLAWTAVEPGHACPMSMTYAAVPALRVDDDQAARWVPGLGSTTYDPGLREPAGKAGLLAGMGMTEKQGGSDVRANITRAVPQSDGSYLLRGHKWFTSAPMDDVFLVLAQAPAGLTCFVMPRIRPGGERNGVQIVRLKDKMGNRSNASAELELHDAYATRLGAEGAGVRTIIEMVAATRLDCVLGSAALMRRATREAAWHCSQRAAFGAALIDQPAMTNVLADLALESEAAVLLGLRLARCVESPGDADEQALRRIVLPLAKLWVCKRTPAVCVEAMECFGGNGYVEDGGMPLLVRESPLNSIWEGSGNVNALDMLRALSRTPHGLSAYAHEVGLARGADATLDRAAEDVLARARAVAADPEAAAQAGARRLAARMAVVLQGALLVRHAPAAVADAFVASRVGGDRFGVLGTLGTGADLPALARRALPQD